ncbi:MAG: hypothetical protein K2M94_08730 [Paramuribaculum sp.]|nr:hypothetical protein [Paramuribaculum sp.]
MLPDSIPLTQPVDLPSEVVEKELVVNPVTDSVNVIPVDTVAIVNSPDFTPLFNDSTIVTKAPVNVKVFTPDPTRAVWLSALCPGLGQIYNRRYWKLPIVIGGFMGLGYGLSWNNSMLTDYSKAYTDIMDNDPNTHSYMNFFPPNTKEEMLNKSWLERVLKSRKDMFRRNRDLCIISMVGVYLLAMVDAYVDASLSNFDISSDLSIHASPCVLRDSMNPYPAPGVLLAITF